MKQFTLMNQNIHVLDFSYDDELHAITKIEAFHHVEFAPLGILSLNGGISLKSLNKWWRERSIPASRDNIRSVLEGMDIYTSVELLEKCFGLSLSDQYWIKEKNSDILWEDINFFTNPFSEDMGKILFGEMEYSDTIDIFSPDNSSDGNLRKKWKIMNHKRYLIKAGNSLNNQEPFNEVIASRLYERILQPDEYVPYFILHEHGNDYSACETMVSTDEELVSAYYFDQQKKLKGSDSLYNHYLSTCSFLGIPDAKEKVDKMLVCDYIIANYDRHYRNFGAIRNVKTLKWKGIAPIFDSGSSLWATTPTKDIGRKYHAKPFRSDPEEQLKLVKDYSWLDPAKLNGFAEDAKEILHQNRLMDEERIRTICLQIANRIKIVQKTVKENRA